MSDDPRRFDDRHLPADLFRASLSWKITAQEASRLARERWEADERRGGDMNARVRARLAELSSSGRPVAYEAARDARGRFAAREKAEGREAKFDMNAAIREQVYGAGAYPDAKPSPSPGQPQAPSRGGDISDRFPHLGEGPSVGLNG